MKTLLRSGLATAAVALVVGSAGCAALGAKGRGNGPCPACYVNLLEGPGRTGGHLVVQAGAPEAWSLGPDGVLRCSGGQGGWIGTAVDDYGDFDLKLEYNVPKEGNSGVYIRRAKEGDGAYTGMEIQVIDDDAKHWGKLQPWQLTGSIYHEVAPAVRATREAGTWQTMEIIAKGPIVKVIINGVPVVRANLDAFTTTTAGNAAPLKDRPRRGHIGFQNHGSGIEYRNVCVKRLD
jgi:hypothetical protein